MAGVEVTISHGLFSNRRTGGSNQRRSRVDDMLENPDVNFNCLAPFKTTPQIFPRPHGFRILPVACRSCVASSGLLISERNRKLGIRDCLVAETNIPIKEWNDEYVPNFLEYLRANEKLSGANFDDDGHPRRLNNTMATGHLSTLPSKGQGKLAVVKRGVQSILNFVGLSEIGKRWDKFCISCFWWMLQKVLSWTFASIWIHKAEIEMLREIHGKSLPIVYLPLNRSIFDPLVLSWTFRNCGILSASFVASHGIMQKPLLKYFANMCGGFDSNRKFFCPTGTESEELSAATYSYFSFLLKKGCSLEFVLESNRSRNGIPSTQLVGVELLSIAVDLLYKKEIEDAYIVPLSISYEILSDFGILAAPTRGSLINQFWNFLTKPNGAARVSIAQPFRLREFQQGIKTPNVSKWGYRNDNYVGVVPLTDTSCSILPGKDLHWDDDDRESCTSVSSIYGETSHLPKLFGDPDLIEPDNDLSQGSGLAGALAHHCIYDATKSSAIMSTHMVAFLLLYKFTQGVTLEDLISEVNLLVDDIRNHRRDLGFCGETKDAVNWAVRCLGPSLVTTEIHNGLTMFKPVKFGNGLMILAYYANQVTQLYAVESIVATGLFSILGRNYHRLLGSNIKKHVDEEKLKERSTEIAQLLKGTFVFYPLCKTMEEIIGETIGSMKEQSLIASSVRQIYSQDEPDEEGWDTFGGVSEVERVYTEQRLYINTNLEIFERLEFLRNLTRPILECYGLICKSLLCLIPSPDFIGELEELELKDLILTDLQREISNLKESGASSETLEMHVEFGIIKSALTNLTNMGVLGNYCTEDNPPKRIIYLEDFYNKEELLFLIDTIYSYCTY